MTKKQIEQSAEKYAEQHKVNFSEDKNYAVYDFVEQKEAYLAGAHSRDEEIEHYRRIATAYKIDAQDIAAECERLHDIIDKLRNPWISAEERLPERMTSRDSNGTKMIHYCSKEVFGYDAQYKIGRLVCYNYESEWWESHDAYRIGKITHWKPIITPEQEAEQV